MERRKRSYFSLWLFCRTESFDLTANNGARNEFGIPDVPNEPCLLLCPHLNLLTLIFSDQAFAAPELSSPEQLFRLRIPSGQKQLPVPLKEEMGHIPLFRRSENTVNGIRISNDQALPDRALRPWMVKLGSVTGMELPTGPYTFRRGNGEALDNSSKYHNRHFLLSFQLISVKVLLANRNATSSYNITTRPCS